MVRPLRIEFPDALYHITSRGNARQDIFLSDHDRNIFLKTVGLVIERYNWICHAYCLMDNHYHLLVQTPNANLSKGMRQLNGVYTQKFNFIHKRIGHIFQGRFKAFLIEKEAYLLEVARYIVLNPVRAKVVISPKEWRWSSYRATIGKNKGPDWLATSFILQHFSKSREVAQKGYLRFVIDGLKAKSPFDNLEEGTILGYQQFIDQIRENCRPPQHLHEIKKSDRLIGRPTLNDLFSKKILIDKVRLDDMIYVAHVKGGYTQKEIADHLGHHYTWVSKRLKK